MAREPPGAMLQAAPASVPARPIIVELAASSLITLRWLMFTRTGTANVGPRGRRVTSPSRAASPPEVQLTVGGPRAAGTARLAAAWTLFGALAVISAVACISFNPRVGRPIGAVLIAVTYGLTIAALLWTAVETRRSDRA